MSDDKYLFEWVREWPPLNNPNSAMDLLLDSEVKMCLFLAKVRKIQ